MSARRFTYTLILLASVALFGYVAFASHMASVGYELDAQAIKLAEMQEEENDLVVQLANTQSPTTVSEYTQVLDLVETGPISGYIDTREENLGLNHTAKE